MIEEYSENVWKQFKEDDLLFKAKMHPDKEENLTEDRMIFVDQWKKGKRAIDSDSEYIEESLEEEFYKAKVTTTAFKIHWFVHDHYYRLYGVELGQESFQKQQGCLDDIISASTLTDAKFSMITYIKKICFGKGIYYWKGIGMSKALFGEGPDLESFKEYFREMVTYQALYAA